MTRLTLTSVLLISFCTAFAETPPVSIERVPDGGIQPRLSTDSEGDTHLLYFIASEAESRRGHHVYRRFDNETGEWGQATNVSPEGQPLFDPIGRPSMAIDSEGRVHVTWFVGGPRPYAYARSNVARDKFSEPAFPVSAHVSGIEAGAALSVSGNSVTLVWHAGDMADESSRRVFSITSTDAGETWGEEIPIDGEQLGVCACCALASTISADGKLSVAYRSAVGNEGRHMQVLNTGTTQTISEWTLDTCPVSTNEFDNEWLAFETKGQIMAWHPAHQPAAEFITASGRDIRQKHPAIATEPDGYRLIAWGEAAGYVKGGALNVVMVGPNGTEVIDSNGASIPDLSHVSAAWTGEAFLVLY